MQYLEENVNIRGCGPGITATLIMRDDKKALYERSDDCFEVFIRKFRPACEILSKSYPDMEVYPGNEEFGIRAWCFRSKDRAEKKYNSL